MCAEAQPRPVSARGAHLFGWRVIASFWRLKQDPRPPRELRTLIPPLGMLRLEHFTRTPNERIRFRLLMEDEHGNDVEAPVKPLELFRYMHAQDFFVWCCG